MLTLLQSDALAHSDANGHTVAIVDALRESYSKKTIREPYPPGVNSNSTEPSKNLSSPAVAGYGSGVGDVATEPHWQHSLQILLQSHLDRHTWYMFQGPYGVAVNPCNPGPFKTVVKDYGDGRKLNFYDPPYVAAGVRWDVNIEGWSDRGHCKYEGRADDPGHLVCDDFLDFPFSKDAGNNGNGVIVCSKRAGMVTWHWSYHRAWVLEY
jgi:hypothetical protein